MKNLNFASFLETKNISKEVFASKTTEESAELYAEYLTDIAKTIDEAVSNGATKEEVKTIQDEQTKAMVELTAKHEAILLSQGVAIKTAIENLNNTSKGSKDTLLKTVELEKESISKAVKATSAHDFVVKADFVRAGVTNSTQALRLDSIGQLAHRKLSAYDLFTKVPVGEGSNGVIRYADWDSATTARAATLVAEGTAFPESTAKFEEYSLTLEKIGDTIPMSEETLYDIPRFTRELDNFLRVNVALVEDAQLVNGTGAAGQMKGVVTSAGTYTAAASGISDANIYDLIVKMHESIITDGSSKYMPNFALMNIVDINSMKLHKDANENYLVPPFVSADGNAVAGMVIVENNGITANSMLVGDSNYGTIYEVENYNVTTGYINDQFSADLVTLKAKKRENLLIRTADAGGFKKVASISAALTTLAT